MLLGGKALRAETVALIRADHEGRPGVTRSHGQSVHG
jgi:hypothetical protein